MCIVCCEFFIFEFVVVFEIDLKYGVLFCILGGVECIFGVFWRCCVCYLFDCGL